MSSHDTWLAGYRRQLVEVFCTHKGCPNETGFKVVYELENGVGAISPDDCPFCGGELVFERVEE